MGTRSIIVVTGPSRHGGKATSRLYKHWDGYPTGNLPIIFEALIRSQAQINLLQKENPKDKPETMNVDQVCGNLIGESTSVYGISANFDTDWADDKPFRPAVYSEAFEPKHLGNQGDLEWIYVIDLESKTLNIYGGSYGDPQTAFIRGTVNPLKYADCLRAECIKPEKLETLKLVESIETLGFKVNPKKSTRKAV